jgi:hypothetical protein
MCRIGKESTAAGQASVFWVDKLLLRGVAM